MILRQVNFSLASTCTARCVFCPTETRGARIVPKVMPYETATAILDEVADTTRFGITAIGIGENGDSFINPHALDVLRYVRKVLPQAKTIVYTNMRHVTPEKAEAIISEHLIDELQFSIDGCTPERYEAMKGLPWETVWTHITGLLEKRNAANGQMRVAVYLIPPTLYRTSIRSLGIEPSRDPGVDDLDPRDEMLAVCDLMKPYLRRPADDVFFQQPFAWAEREQFEGQSIDYAGKCCPLLPRASREAFIAPDGTWYVCCYDANQDHDLGNVRTEGVYAVATGEKRRAMLSLLERGRFEEAGGPCRTVNCCQGL